jgi:hypothetical protein
MQKAPKPLAHLLMREIFATLQSILATLHGFDKAVFFLEISGYNVLHKLIGLAPLLGRSRHEPCFESGIKLNVHTPQDTEKSACRQDY